MRHYHLRKSILCTLLQNCQTAPQTDKKRTLDVTVAKLPKYHNRQATAVSNKETRLGRSELITKHYPFGGWQAAYTRASHVLQRKAQLNTILTPQVS